MMDMNLRVKLRQMLVRHEGWRNFPYVDSVGKTTIGCGFNLSDRGLPDNILAPLLEQDMEYHYNMLDSTFLWFKDLVEARKLALIDMSFNLGFKGFCKFEKMLDALSTHDYKRAAKEMKASGWYTQVKSRGQELVDIMRTGELV